MEAETRGVSNEPWVSVSEYSVRIGGIVYRNVEHPITVNGEPVLTLRRNTQTGKLGVSFNVSAEDGSPIAKVKHNILLDIADGYFATKGSWGTSLIESKTGRVWCDIRPDPVVMGCELDVSCLLFFQDACPIFLHPDRTCIGLPHGNNAPNFAGFTIKTEEKSPGGAFQFSNAHAYLIDIAIENLARGITLLSSSGSNSA